MRQDQYLPARIIRRLPKLQAHLSPVHRTRDLPQRRTIIPSLLRDDGSYQLAGRLAFHSQRGFHQPV